MGNIVRAFVPAPMLMCVIGIVRAAFLERRGKDAYWIGLVTRLAGGLVFLSLISL